MSSVQPVVGLEEIGGHRLLRSLGKGEFGEVWLSRDPTTQEEVALKILRMDKVDPADVERFKQEFEILCELRHAHLARVFHFGFVPDRKGAGQYFFTSEFCPGRNLLQAMEGHNFSYFEEVLVQVLSALDYIHSRGIIHFDIKAQNILVEDRSGRPHVKLVDFGLAARLKNLPEGRAGTIAYMAPEILARSPRIDHRADLYSLGMLCLRILSGAWPFDVQNPQEILSWHLRGTVPESIWKGQKDFRYLQELTLKLIQKRPSERFSHAKVVLNFLNLAAGYKYTSVEKEFRGQIPSEGPLIEREDLLEELQAAFRETFFSAKASDHSSVFYLCGEQGIGKSRVLAEMRHTIELHEIPVVDLVCDWKIPTWPRLLKILNLGEGEFSEESLADFVLRQRIDRFLEASRRRPFCLLIDDLHKAEPEFQTLIRETAVRTRKDRREGRGHSLFILVATEQETPELAERRTLHRLSDKAVLQYAHQVLGETEGIASVAKVLFEYSGGLPLLVVEGMRYLAPHFYRGDPLENRLPPPQISLLYDEKIRSLDEREREILLVSALLFRPFEEEMLAPMEGLSVSEITRLTSKPLRLGLLSRIGTKLQVSSQALSLDLIRGMDAAGSGIRPELHKKIAQGLQQEGCVPSEEMAYHLAGAGLKEEAILVYEKAAERLKMQGQISTAARSLMKARDLSREGTESWERLSLESARFLILSGLLKEAEEVLQGLDGTDSWQKAEITGWLAARKRDFDTARNSYTRALEKIPPDHLLEKILLMNGLANLDLQGGKIDPAVTLFQETVHLEKSLSGTDRMKVHNNNLGLALSLQGNHTEALQVLRQRFCELPSAMIPGRIAILNATGFVLLRSSCYREAVETLREALRLAEQSGAFHALFSILGNLTTALLKENRYTECLSVLKKMGIYQERLGTTRDVAFNLLREGSVSMTLGMEEAAEDCFRKGSELGREISDRTLGGWFLLMRGYWQREFGTAERAVQLFQEASAQGEETQVLDLVAWTHYAMADLLTDKGEVRKAQEELLQIKTRGDSDDEEFEVRIHLLKLKIQVAGDRKMATDKGFSNLEERCLNGNFHELLWEVYHAWGLFHWKGGRRERAREFWKKGMKVVESISLILPEEYRDRYLRVRSRKKLHDDWKEGPSMGEERILVRLLEVSKRMVSERNPEKLLEFIMDEAVELSGAEQGLLLLKEGESWEPRVARNVKKENLEVIRFSRSVAEEVMKTERPLVSFNAADDLKSFASVISLDLKTVACVPLKIHDRIMGVIYLDTRRPQSSLERDFLPTLEAFADQASLALQNAMLFREKETYSQKLEEQVHELEALVSVGSRKTLFPYEKIVGRSKKMEEVLKTLDKVTNAAVPVFIYGETGTGKELLARALHQNSIRKDQAFVAVNCSAFTETILESELFGYLKGAFTGADRDRKGLFEVAHQGTLFLDEVADMSLAMQAKLLRVIQEQEVLPVGGRSPIKVSVRIVSASNKDLKKLVREGKFREDLFYRIAGITIGLPPLRERREDLPLLIKYFVDKIRKENRLGTIRIGREVNSKLMMYNWPGNIRELEQCLTNACLLAEGGEIKPEHLLLQKELYEEKSSFQTGGMEGIPFQPDKKMEDYEKEVILKMLEYCGGNKSETAKRLGLSRLTLHKRLNIYKST